MGGPFNEGPFPQLTVQDFGPNRGYRVELEHNCRAVVIGDIDGDLGLQLLPGWVTPGPDAIDVHIHGLPGRFIEALAGVYEIPADVVVELLKFLGIQEGISLRLVTCHGGEPCANGRTAAQMLADIWGGTITAPNGLLRVYPSGQMEIDMVDWENVGGLWLPKVIGPNQGSFVSFPP